MKYLLLFLPLLFACEKKNNANVENLVDAASQLSEADGYSCLLDYQGKLDQLLTQDMVLAATGFSAELATKTYKENAKHKYEYLNYKFKNKRLGEIEGVKGTFELSDIITLRSLHPMTKEEFTRNYKEITAEENKAMKEHLSREVETNEDVDQIRKNANNLSKQEVKETGGKLLDSFTEISTAYSRVGGVADMASWNSITQVLYVLYKDTHFELYVNASNENETNKKIAVNLAKMILQSCK